MSLLAVLKLGDNHTAIYNREYLVVDCTFQLSKHYNYQIHRTDSDAQCGVIELTLVAPSKKDLTLYEWYIDRSLLSGQIRFDLSSLSIQDDDKEQKTVCFEDAYCFSVTESYSINRTQKRLLKIELIAQKMTVDTVTFHKT